MNQNSARLLLRLTLLGIAAVGCLASWDAWVGPAAADPPADKKPWRFGGPSIKSGSGDVSIHVVDGAGSPRAAPRIRVTTMEEGKVKVAFDGPLDDAGRVLASSIAPGNVLTTVTLGELRHTVFAQVAAGRTTEIDISLPRGVAVEGEVRQAASGPLPGIDVTLHDAGTRPGVSDTLTTKTDGSGRYAFAEVPAGRWTVSLRGGALGHSDRARGAVTVPATGRVTHDFVVGRVTFKGTVRDGSTGFLVPGVRLQLRDLDVPPLVTTTGEFSFEDLPAGGPYTLLVTAEGFGERFLKTGQVPEPGAEPLSMDIVLQPAATLVVRLVDPAGRPVVGEFWLGFQAPGAAGGISTQVQADEKGECTFRRAVPGRYRVDVRKDGYAADAQEIELKGGKNELRFVLTPARGK